jgi:hypothetical protein
MIVSAQVVIKTIPNKDITVWLYVEHAGFGTIMTHLEHYMTRNDPKIHL